MLTVSIVTYHTDADELRACLASLRAKCVSRIFIVDNAQEERIRAIAGEHRKTTYIPLPNPGYGAAHNVAIRKGMESGARYHLVLNSDVRFEPVKLDRLVEIMESRPEVGQLQPQLLNTDGSLQYSVRRLPSPLDVFGRRFLPRWLINSRDARYTLRTLDRSREHNIPYHQGSFMLLRTAALHETGLFDERFFMYPEDIDLTRRIHRRYVTLFYPFITVTHAHRAGSYHSLRLLRIHAINMIRYFNKWGWTTLRDTERKLFNSEIEPENPKQTQYGKTDKRKPRGRSARRRG